MFHLTREGIHSNSIYTFSLLSRLLGSQRECRYVWFWGEALHFPWPSPSFPCAVTSWLCDALMSLDAAWVSPVIPNYCTNKSCTCGVWHCWNSSLFLPHDQKVEWHCSPSLVKWQRWLLAACWTMCSCMGWCCSPRLWWVQAPSQVCWTPARVPCTSEYFVLAAGAAWLLTRQSLHMGALTRFTPAKNNSSVWQQISEMWGQLWYLFVWLNSGLYGPVTARWDEPWQGKCITGSDSDKKSL